MMIRLLFLFILMGSNTFAQLEVPHSHSNIFYDKEGKLYFQQGDEKFYEAELPPRWTIDQLLGSPEGNPDGITMDFKGLKGTVTYGLIPYGKAPHPLPVYRFTKTIDNGKISINIKDNFKYPYDFVDWKDNQKLTLGYRVQDTTGMILFDGEVSVLFESGEFQPAPTIYEGPFVSFVTDTSAVISFETSVPTLSSVNVGGEIKKITVKKRHHEYTFSHLKPSKKYEYEVNCGKFTQSYHFTTAPKKGSRAPFVFAYASDSRHGSGGGERKIYGANAYIMKKIAALAYKEKAAFVQFSGDMINGYLGNKEEMMLQYSNWKKSIEPFWHYMPWYVSMGNHEALGHVFKDENEKTRAFIDKFPYDSLSGEQAFKEAFVNPENGPTGEDGGPHDPNKKSVDFPSYSENVYYYTYGNVAMIVLNSNYWFAPSLKKGLTSTGGGLHAYIMDTQLEWLKQTLEKLEKDNDIDHVFVTQHTPAFPNGGHSGDDMWYNGNNDMRPYINENPVEKGIIERRDEYLDLLINKSSKVIGLLTGDEHNYNWLKLTKEVPIYAVGYEHEKLQVSRPIYQINNGSAGAPYYGQEKLPWSEFTQSFSVEFALCLFEVEGDKIVMRVINPDTLNEIDRVVLKEGE